MTRSSISLFLLSLFVATAVEARTIQFSGLTWYVRSSGNAPSAPGPNYFSDSTNNVWVDAEGRLHLKITKRRGRWSCAEVIAATSIGYGTYRFYVDSPVGTLDPNIVAGLFTWSDDPAYNHREIDIEFARWGHAANPNAQYVVQPYTHSSNIMRFEQPADARTTHAFTWQPHAVDFVSLRGHRTAASTPEELIHQWTGFSSVPIPGGENPRINFWLSEGKAPQNGREAELIIRRVEFIPLQ
jgi:hypothetical protein